MRNVILFGADVELGLIQNESPIPGWEFFSPALDKHNKEKLLFWEECPGEYHLDNVAVEVNPKATSKPEHLIELLNKARDALHLLLPDAVQTSHLPYLKYNKEHMQHYLAQQIGCDPDLNLWTNKIRRTKNARTLKNIRTFGGHIHCSVNAECVSQLSATTLNYIGALMEQHIGVPLFLHSPYPNEERQRHKFYGAFGAIRHKSYYPTFYGTEYRVPSSWWPYERVGREIVIAGLYKVKEKLEEYLALDIEEQENQFNVLKEEHVKWMQ